MTRKIELPSYLEIRQKLEIAHQRIGVTPCIKGKAECCDRDVPMTQADVTFLLRGFETGMIHREVKAFALRNALDKCNDRCVFLGEGNECMIYTHRPLICMAWCIGGEPKPQYAQWFALRKLMQDSTGIEQFVAQDEIMGFACPSCAEELIRNSPRYPLSVIEATTTASLYLNVVDETRGLVSNFVKKYLRR